MAATLVILFTMASWCKLRCDEICASFIVYATFSGRASKSSPYKSCDPLTFCMCAMLSVCVCEGNRFSQLDRNTRQYLCPC